MKNLASEAAQLIKHNRLIGYSYGGAAALELAWELAPYDDSSPPMGACTTRFMIDKLVLIDVEDDGRWLIRKSATIPIIPDNVKDALNLYATHGRWYPPGVYLDGVDYFADATNIEITGTNHATIMNIDMEEGGHRINPATMLLTAYFLLH